MFKLSKYIENELQEFIEDLFPRAKSLTSKVENEYIEVKVKDPFLEC
jgi:hypothetical protein